MFGLSGESEDKLRAHFLFPKGFIGFQGHFPDKPVLPGVCKVQAVITMLGAWHKRGVGLKEIVLAKFFVPVSYGERLTFECQEHKRNSEEILVKALVTRQGKKVAELQLKVIFENVKRGGDEAV
jgi:3-hydroxyacyl-[acyl-carrier-protein] dehydratase